MGPTGVRHTVSRALPGRSPDVRGETVRGRNCRGYSVAGVWYGCVVIRVTAVLAILLLAPAGAAAAEPTVTAKITGVASLGLDGVSPFALSAGGGASDVWYSGGGATQRVSCTPAGACTPTGSIPQITDLSIVTLADGTRRAYFKEVRLDLGQQVIASALIGADGMLAAERVQTGIAASTTERAWGVPDAVLGPDGRVRLFWTAPGRGGEVTKSAKATDATGTAFTVESGDRTTGGLVDFEVLQAKKGAWVAIASTTPGRPPQRLLIGTSPDGRTWTFGKTSLTSLDSNALDPAAYPIGRNRYRLFYVTSPKADPFSGFDIVQATLTLRRR